MLVKHENRFSSFFFGGGELIFQKLSFQNGRPNGVQWPREPGLESPANWGPKKDKKAKRKKTKKHILSNNDDLGKLSKFPEKTKKTVIFLKINWLYS